MNGSIVPEGSDARRRIREMVARMEREYESKLKTCAPEDAAKLRKQMEKNMKREKRKLILNFSRRRSGCLPVLW